MTQLSVTTFEPNNNKGKNIMSKNKEISKMNYDAHNASIGVIYLAETLDKADHLAALDALEKTLRDNLKLIELHREAVEVRSQIATAKEIGGHDETIVKLEAHLEGMEL